MSDRLDSVFKFFGALPEWAKGMSMAAVIVLTVLWLNGKSSAEEGRLDSLSKSVTTHEQQLKSLQKEVDGMSYKIDRLEGKIDILLARWK